MMDGRLLGLGRDLPDGITGGIPDICLAESLRLSSSPLLNPKGSKKD
jgi:hypothetical protein